MKNKKNYYIRILLILIIVPSMWWYLSTKRKYREMNTVPHIKMEMKEFLKKTYNEDFNVTVIPYAHDDYYEGIIFPKRYEGTSKEYDPFYKTDIYMDIEKIPVIDEYKHTVIMANYEDIQVKEGLEKGLKPKLEELFGKNVLVALQLEGVCKYGNYKEEIEYRKKKGKKKPLSGGIYIFGRVENEKDREKYRKGIYEFIQYLKQEGMFEYVDMVIKIYDERCLAPSYEEVVKKLKEEREIQKNSTDYKKAREKILATLTKKYSQMTEKEKQEKLNSIIKSNMLGENGWNNDFSYSQIYHRAIYSPKTIKTNYFLNDMKPLNYDSIDEVKLYDTVKIKYKEFDQKKLSNNEWGD